MLYKCFNIYIHDYFFNDEKITETVVMAVDENVIKCFCEKYKKTDQELH
jgi:hypothetical protein